MTCTRCGKSEDCVSVEIIFQEDDVRKEYLCANCLLDFFDEVKRGVYKNDKNSCQLMDSSDVR